MKHKQQYSISYREMARIFLFTGAQAFGGWSTTVLLLEKKLVNSRKGISAQQLKAAITYAQILPGATQVAIVSNLGYQLRGARGSVVAAVSYLLPSVTLITVFAAIYFHFADTANIAKHLDGLIAALGGIILANAYKIGGKHANHLLLWIFAASAFTLQYWFHIHALIIIIAFGGCGIAYYYIRKQWLG